MEIGFVGFKNDETCKNIYLLVPIERRINLNKIIAFSEKKELLDKYNKNTFKDKFDSNIIVDFSLKIKYDYWMKDNIPEIK